MSRIIFLNGCGSSGKSTIARELQSQANTPWLHFSMDKFIGMLPLQYIEFGEKAKEGYYQFEHKQNDKGDFIKIKRGAIGANFFDTLPHIAKILADNNNDLIIDEVITKENNLKDYLNILSDHKICMVKVNCDLETLNTREQARGDRLIGLSNEQFDLINNLSFSYDLILDTHLDTAVNLAGKILKYIDLDF